jgi:CheY-like chemotaxis protein
MKRIFIIDDEVDFCYFIKNNLELTGEFEVATCSDSTKAVSMVKELRPDLLLVDIMMPGISGEDIVALLQEDPTTQKIPYIFLTGIITSKEAEGDENIIAGHHFIAKPIEIKKLVSIINTVLKYSDLPE